MAEQKMRYKSGRLIGSIKILSDGKHEGRDESGRLKGCYDPQANQSRDASGWLVGTGDLLASLVISGI
jgi:hypothetical protein